MLFERNLMDIRKDNLGLPMITGGMFREWNAVGLMHFGELGNYKKPAGRLRVCGFLNYKFNLRLVGFGFFLIE